MSNTSSKKYKCPFCSNVYIEKKALYNHMEAKHEEQLHGLPPAQIYFNIKNHKDHGECIICKRHTKFNLDTEKYERLCDRPQCKEAYRQMFLDRMRKKYGKDTLLNDEEQQRKMLENRKITKNYVWSTNPKIVFKAVGQYEYEFLEFMDIFMHWNPQDLFMPSPILFKYKYQNEMHSYYPDAFIPSLNLIIEIKAYDNKHYRERDIAVEKAKDKVVNASQYNYFKVHDKLYDDFFKYLREIIAKNADM